MRPKTSLPSAPTIRWRRFSTPSAGQMMRGMVMVMVMVMGIVIVMVMVMVIVMVVAI